MSAIRPITEAIHRWTAPQESGRFVVVPTFALYPSNASVQAFIDGDRDSFTVSDGGGAIETFMKSGDFRCNPIPALKSFSRRFGLSVSHEGWIFAMDVPSEQVTSFVSLVTECSKQAAEFLLRRFRPETRHDFRPELREIIEERFHSSYQSNAHWLGESNKRYRFDYTIRLGGERVALIDAVKPDSSSINAAIIAHLDVQRVHNDNVAQAIVYDESEDWKAADLALLRLGAQPVAFAGARSFLGALAA